MIGIVSVEISFGSFQLVWRLVEIVEHGQLCAGDRCEPDAFLGMLVVQVRLNGIGVVTNDVILPLYTSRYYEVGSGSSD